MRLLDKIKKEADKALKERNRARLSVLRVLLAAIKNREIAKRPKKLEEADIKEVIAKEIKDREEGIRIYKGANVSERVDMLEAEIKILREFLPLLNEAEINDLIDKAISSTSASSEKDMGRVLGFVMPKLRGQADPEQVRVMITKKLRTAKGVK